MEKTFPEIKLIPQPETDEAKEVFGHKWAEPEIGYRHKLGGNPEWIQDDEWPECCQKKMTFFAQLDSVGDDIHLGDCGLIYVFVCFDCFNTKSMLQCG